MSASHQVQERRVGPWPAAGAAGLGDGAGEGIDGRVA